MSEGIEEYTGSLLTNLDGNWSNKKPLTIDNDINHHILKNRRFSHFKKITCIIDRGLNEERSGLRTVVVLMKG